MRCITKVIAQFFLRKKVSSFSTMETQNGDRNGRILSLGLWEEAVKEDFVL